MMSDSDRARSESAESNDFGKPTYHNKLAINRRRYKFNGSKLTAVSFLDRIISNQLDRTLTTTNLSDNGMSTFGDFDGPDYIFRTQKPSELCSFCRYLFENWAGFNVEELKATVKIPHCKNLFAFQTSVDAGCTLCAQFLRGYSRDGDINIVEKEMARRKEEGVGSLPGFLEIYHSAQPNDVASAGVPGRAWVSLRLTFPVSRRQEHKSEMKLSSGNKVFHVDIEYGPEPNSNSSLTHLTSGNTRDGLALVSQWFEKCCTSHSLCAVNNSQINPTRLIYIGDKTPRLCLNTQDPKRRRYATLSHCWGAPVFQTLIRDNLKDFEKRIPPEALSKTFHDSIFIVKELKIDYLWIDSLCILQDDIDDWRKESALMGSVYGGSTINIAASRAVDGNGGCFASRDKTWICQISTGNEEKTLFRCVPRFMYHQSLTEMPLLRRGWTLQERLLAPRTVHFAESQLFWECHENIACESFPDKFPAALTQKALAPGYLKKGSITRSMWEWIISQYSRCNLTKNNDKLVAISGLARSLQTRTNDEYIAGLWREDLELQLCWNATPLAASCPRSESYIAPTWSWASVNSTVKFHGQVGAARPKHLFIKVVDVSTTPVGEDPLGAISKAHLHLRCDVFICGTLHGKIKLLLGGRLVTLLIVYDCARTSGDVLYFMPVERGSRGVRDHTIVGLILEPTDNARGQYRRVGKFVIADQKSSRAFELAAQHPECQAKDLDYMTVREDNDGKMERIIEII